MQNNDLFHIFDDHIINLSESVKSVGNTQSTMNKLEEKIKSYFKNKKK